MRGPAEPWGMTEAAGGPGPLHWQSVAAPLRPGRFSAGPGAARREGFLCAALGESRVATLGLTGASGAPDSGWHGTVADLLMRVRLFFVVVTPPDAEDKLRDIRSVTDAALSHLSADDLLITLLRRVREIPDADTAAVLLLDSSGRQLIATAASGHRLPELPRRRLIQAAAPSGSHDGRRGFRVQASWREIVDGSVCSLAA
jgi:hypothetical protein